MSADDNVRIVKTTMDELMRGDPGPLLSAMTEDVVIKAVLGEGTPISGDFRGKDGVLRYLTLLNEVMEIREAVTTDITASEGHVVMLGFEKARVRRTGKMLDCEIATVFSMRDGKIARLVAFADMSAIMDAYRPEGAV